MATVSVDSLLRFGSVALLAGSAAVGIGKFIYEKYYEENNSPYSRRARRSARNNNNEEENKNNKTPVLQKTIETVTKLVRVTALPVTTIACAWSLVRNPEHLPAVIPPLFRNYSQAATSKFVPLFAKNLTEAFELGQVYREHKQAQMFKDDAGIENALKKATTLLRRTTPITSEQLNALPQTLSDIDKKKGPFQRMLGLLSITNIAQGVATVVIAGTIIPFTVAVFGEKLAKLLENFFYSVILPLHNAIEPAYEPLCYLATCIAAIESARYPRGDSLSMTGTLSAFTSIVMFVMSWLYTTQKISHGGGDRHLWMSMTSIMFTAYTVPLAILHQSKFLGYLAAVGAAVAFGFSAFSTGMCLFLGFESEKDLARGTLGCALLSIAFAALRAQNVDSRYLAPFEGPVSTVSTSVFFLGMLILAEAERYHLQFVGCGISYIVAGELLGLQGMSNAAKTWLGIYGFSRFCMFTYESGNIIAVFSGAVATFFIARFLSRNPKYLAAAIFG